MVGRTISHYQIIEKLGTGGMGEIYKALDPRLNRFVAIKVLPAAMSADPASRRRFVHEAQAASGLNHPNIITIYDVISDQETEFILMEYVAGKTLLDLIPPGGFPIPRVLDYAVQIADALSAAHAAGIIHRDLKPANVMATEAGLVKVLDFGLAKLDSNFTGPVGDDGETIAIPAHTLTIEGSILGTVNYMSPEQAQGFRVDARSDIFSFGVLVYEMVTGIRPFTGDSPVSTLSSILRDEARPVGEITPAVPRPLQEIIARCLRKNPADRWQTMQEVRTLLAALKQDSSSNITFANRLPAPPPRRSSVPAFLALGLILAAAVAGVWWFARRPAPQPPAHPVSTAAAPPSHPAAIDKPSPMPPPAPVEPPKQEAPIARVITLVDGLPVAVTLAEDIPANSPVGAPIRFTVTKNFEVAGVVVIQKGAPAAGEIAQEGKKKFLGFGGKMMLRLLTVSAADDQTLKLRATPKPNPTGLSERPVEQGGHARPKGVAAIAGTEYVGYLDGNQNVTVQK
jgi:serine/threonine-protein kinase